MSVATITRPAPSAPAPVTTWTMPSNLTDSERLAYRRAYSRTMTRLEKLNPSGVSSDGPSPAIGTAARTMLARRIAGTMVAAHEERHPAAHKSGMTAVRSWVRKYDSDPAARLALIVDPAAPVAAPRTVVAVAPKVRKVSKLTPCTRHTAKVDSLGRADALRWCVEGGLGSPCTDGSPCVLLPGTDRFTADICTGPLEMSWTTAPAKVRPVTPDQSDAHTIVVAVTGRPAPVADESPAVPDAAPAAMPDQTRDARRASNRELAAAMRARGINPTGAAWQLARAGADLDQLAATVATITPAGVQ